MTVGEPQWNTEVVDDIGLRYVVPLDKLDAWYDWVAAVVDGHTPNVDTPDWAHCVGSHNVQFTEWKALR